MKKVIGVIDDNPDFNAALCEILQEEGYAVLSFNSGTAFLRQHPQPDRACEVALSVTSPAMA